MTTLSTTDLMPDLRLEDSADAWAFIDRAYLVGRELRKWLGYSLWLIGRDEGEAAMTTATALVAKQHDVSESTVRRWRLAAERDLGLDPATVLSASAQSRAPRGVVQNAQHAQHANGAELPEQSEPARESSHAPRGPREPEQLMLDLHFAPPLVTVLLDVAALPVDTQARLASTIRRFMEAEARPKALAEAGHTHKAQRFSGPMAVCSCGARRDPRTNDWH